MRYIKDVKVGHKFMSKTRDEGIVISVTKRTITAKFSKSTVKQTYYSSKCEYPLNEF